MQAETILYHRVSEQLIATEQPNTVARPVVDLLDQTKLPGELTRLECRTPQELHDAIVRLVVRGAPAIGIAAAYGVTLAPVTKSDTLETAKKAYLETIDYLATSRPTAVNLFWALDRMRDVVDEFTLGEPGDLHRQLADTATRIHEDDREMCAQIGIHGAGRLSGNSRFLTHCNAGGLATSTLGTALSPLYHMHQSGIAIKVFADETRPLLQGARLTAWELSHAGIDVSVCTDSMAGAIMQSGQIDAVIVGADRIAANGDAANKIGTYSVAVLAKYHNIPFFVAAPTNTFDPTLSCGDKIPIEQRHRDEIAYPGGARGCCTVPDASGVINPAFDVTPAELITAIITQRGVIESPTRERVMEHLG